MAQPLDSSAFIAFPALESSGFIVTSDATDDYNCVAWAAGDDTQWWWPSAFAYWPSWEGQGESIEAFIGAFESLGYVRCDSDEPEPECEKVAIYGTAAGVPTHAARQLPSGNWTSKLGKLQDIEHRKPTDLSGPVYGSPVVFLKRPISRPADDHSG